MTENISEIVTNINLNSQIFLSDIWVKDYVQKKFVASWHVAMFTKNNENEIQPFGNIKITLRFPPNS